MRAIRDYLAMLPGVLTFRANTGALPVGDRFVRFGIEGFPDLFGSMPWCWLTDRPLHACRYGHGGVRTGGHGPRPWALEVKRPGAKRSPTQLAMAATLEAAGWLYACVESVADVQRALGR